MSYEQRKINRQKREKRYRRFIISIGLILVLIIISSLASKNVNTILALEDIFLKEIVLESVVIKDEKVFKLEEAKDLDLKKLEGQKIPAGIKVGNSTVLNDINILKKELTEIENAISNLEKTGEGEVFKNDKKKLIESYNENINKLQENIDLSNYRDIEEIKEEVILINEKIEELSPQNPLLGKDIDSLREKKEDLKNEIYNKSSSYISESSGILSYEIDGYENIFKTEDFENYTYDKLSISDEKNEASNKSKEEKTGGNFKIIDNFQWYLALKIEDRKTIGNYEIGNKLLIKYPLDEKEIEISGDIIAINNSSNKSVIIVRFNQYLHDLYKDRFPKVKLIQEKLDVLKIPNSVILEIDGVKGVYIKDFSGIVKFKAIELIKTIDDYSYVSKGENSIISIGKNKKEMETISIYDEILLKPKKFKKGQIIN